MTIDLIDWDDENADVCGETYDHDEVSATQDGMTTYECRRCGAEWWEDEDDD